MSDTEKLIEAAERWAKNVSESPGNGTAGEDLYGAKLLISLAAALRETTAREEAAELDAAQLRAAFKVAGHTSLAEEMRKGLTTAFELAKVARERDALAAANVAANKRIVALEHERDERTRMEDGLHDALRACDESRNELIDGLRTARDTMDLGKRLIQTLTADRDAARAELARLTTPLSSPALAAIEREHGIADKDGHGIDGKTGTEAHRNRGALLAEIRRLTTPRPIAEAPKEERSRILARGRDGQWREMRLVRGEWRWSFAGTEYIESPTEYFPIPVLP